MEAFYWCLDCGNGLCTNCKNIHRVMRNHTIVDIEKLPANYRLSFCCPQHKNQFLNFFCIDHDKLCCLQCRHDQHPNCTKIEHIDFLSKACRISQTVTDYEDHLYVFRGLLTNTIRILSRNIDTVKEDFTRIIYLIADQKQNQSDDEEGHAMRFQVIEQELAKTKASCLNTLELHIANIKAIKAITDEHKLLFEFFEQNGSNKLLFLLINSTKHNLLERRASIQDWCENIIHLSIHFNGYDKKNPTVGSIEVVERIDEIYQSETNVQNPIGPATVSFEDELVIRTTKIQDSFAVSKNGYLLVCSTSHLVIIINAGHRHTEEHITLSHTPKEISIIPDTDTAVLTCQSADIIQFVDINERKNKSISVKGSANCSIACTPEFILVGDQKNIIILDHDGNSIRKIEIAIDLCTLFYSNERIYFIENRSKEIRCIGMNGDDIYRYQSKNVDSPISAIPNKEGHVFVLDSGPLELYKLSAYGRDIPLEIKGKADLNNARSICFNNDCTKLYVLKKDRSSRICAFKILK